LPAFLPVESDQRTYPVICLGPEGEASAAVSTSGGRQPGEAAPLVLGRLVLVGEGPLGDPHAAAVPPLVELAMGAEAAEPSREAAECWWGGQKAPAEAPPPGFQVAST